MAARRWLCVRVELVSGRGEDFDPPPGRDLVLPPRTTFADLGEAIDLAFARWDLAHLRQFVLADGTVVADETTPVKSLLKPEDHFTYVFDLRDDWKHECTVLASSDPDEVLGIMPSTPTAYWGWGAIPDQHGRRWAEDDGESDPPKRPSRNQTQPEAKPIDLGEVRRAQASGDAGTLIEAMRGSSIDEALQQVGAALQKLYGSEAPKGRETLAPYVISLVERLRRRGWEGDAILADQLLAVLRDEQLDGTALPVDLDECEMALTLGGDNPGAYVDRTNGEVVAADLADAFLVGEDAAIDVEDDKWLYIEGDLSEWRDMADFIETVSDPAARAALERAVHGKGAFSRFRSEVHEHDLKNRWHTYSSDRAWGRAREILLGRGIRSV